MNPRALLLEIHRRIRALTPRRRGKPPADQLESLRTRIEESRVALGAFGDESDREFSSLARGLAQLGMRLAEVRTHTGSLEAVLQDRDEDRAISSAYALYKDSVDLVHANAGIAVSAQDQLTQVEAALVHSCRARQAFERDYLFQRIVTLSIRIEASRLDPEAQSVFLNVASAIADTGEQIQRCTARAFGRIEEVMAESQAARLELRQTEQSLHLKARRSIDTLQRELAALQSALAPCTEHSQVIGTLLGEAQPRMLAVIAALQHQDIVRQQLEHVAAGFQDIEAQVGGAGTQVIEWDYVHHAAHVQAGQLDASRMEIEHAGTAVVGGLQGLLDTSATLMERFSLMESTAAAALDHCSIAQLFRQELLELARVIDQSQQANSRTGRLVQRIEEVVRVFSEEIGRYEFDVKIVALNAQIAAARLTSANALNRLSEETSAMSDANANATRQLTADLQASLAKLDLVKREGAEFLAIVTREKVQLERGLEIVSVKLSRLIGHVRSGAEEAGRSFAPVHDECRRLLDGLCFPSQIERTFGPAAELCRELSAAGGSARTGAPTAAALERIQQHRRRYTMHKEEARHAAALHRILPSAAGAGAPALRDPALLGPDPAASPSAVPVTRPAEPAPALPAADAPSCPAGGFGDGIELF